MHGYPGFSFFFLFCFFQVLRARPRASMWKKSASVQLPSPGGPGLIITVQLRRTPSRRGRPSRWAGRPSPQVSPPTSLGELVQQALHSICRIPLELSQSVPLGFYFSCSPKDVCFFLFVLFVFFCGAIYYRIWYLCLFFLCASESK